MESACVALNSEATCSGIYNRPFEPAYKNHRRRVLVRAKLISFIWVLVGVTYPAPFSKQSKQYPLAANLGELFHASSYSIESCVGAERLHLSIHSTLLRSNLHLQQRLSSVLVPYHYETLWTTLV